LSINALTNFGVPGLNGDRSAVLQPKLSQRFRVTFFNFGEPGEVAPYDLTRGIQSVSRPSYKFDQQALHSYVSTVYIATKVEFNQPLKVKLFDDIDNTVSRRVQQQISKQHNFFDQTSSRAGENYKFEMDVDVLAGGGAAAGGGIEGNVLERWSIVGCFIANQSNGDLGYAESKALEIDLDIYFDNAILFDQNGNRLGTFDHSPEIDGRIGDFSTGIGGNN
jgi:hypothetical protein